MKAKKIIGTILIVIGVLLIISQILSVLGGGIPVMSGAYTSTLLMVYKISSLIGYFTPGLVGVILCAIGVKVKGKVNNKKEG